MVKNLSDRKMGAAIFLGVVVAGRVFAQAELPLAGAAFVIADQGYKAYSQGNYSLAAEKAREAIRLRPDVAALKVLLSRAEAAERGVFSGSKRDKASDTSTSSKTSKKTKRTESAMAASSQSAADQPASIATASPPDPAFLQAESGYRAYEMKEYPAAATYAVNAVRLAPGNRDYRYLLLNALIAADRLDDADDAAAQALLVTAGDDGLVAQQEQIRNVRAQKSAASAYVAFDAGNFALAVSAARDAVRLAPSVPNYRSLLTNALFRAGQYAEAEESLNLMLAGKQNDASLVSQRGFIRQRRGMVELARQDFESALSSGGLPLTTEIELLVEVGRKGDAKSKFESAMAAGQLRDVPDTQLAYLAVRVKSDAEALAAFNRADAAGTLQNTAYQDAAFAALRSRNDTQAITYFKRTIDEVESLRLRMEPQLLFNTRRAVSEVSREWGLIASLSYRGAVPGAGVSSGAADSLQAGVEVYWRPWGYNNGQYAEVFARAFETLHSSGGATGADTLQAAVGLRYKPLTEQNLVVSLSRVMSPRKGRNDWLAQVAYSADRGTDLRVDVPSWWTLRSSAEFGRYLSARQNYALGQVQVGKSFRVGDDQGRWVLFPHLSLAADYDSAAIEQSSAGLGPGITARYWFREDRYAAVRSYVDLSAQYRLRISGAGRAKGLFVGTTLSY